MKIKILKKKISLSRRIFNKFLIINFSFLLSNNLFQKNKINKRKKIKLNNHIWLLNEND
tara:strand:+ start:631 stop:807 length:177 start_codon:yes stop_codon:yes gene_type:complete